MEYTGLICFANPNIKEIEKKIKENARGKKFTSPVLMLSNIT
jgi:hypothetical protein